MARYELPQYQTMYRDPQSVAINEELRTRFVDSFQADDTLASAVDGMQSADFEGDLAAKQKFTEQYNTQIDDRASRGDYETLAMAINKDARSFVKDYTPLLENKKKYDSWTASLKEMEELGDEKGGVTSVTAQKMRSYAKHNYLGIQYDEDGNLVEDSYFAGPNVVKDVNLEQRMQEEMKDVVERSWSSETEEPLTDLGILLDKDGKPQIGTTQEPGKPIKYWITTKNGVEEIPPHLVNEATNRVLKHDDVQASLSQKAMLQNFQLDAVDENGAMQVTNELDDYEVQLGEAIAELEAKSTLTSKEESQLNALQERLNETIDSREANGDMNTMNNLTKRAIEDDFAESNQVKYAYENREFEQSYDVDELFKLNAKKKVDLTTETVSSTTGALEIDPLGGLTSEDKYEYINNAEVAMNSDLSDLVTAGGGTPSSAANQALYDEIASIEDFSDEALTDIAAKYNMDPELFRQQATNILVTKQKKDLVAQKIKETELALFGDTYENDISNEFAELTKNSSAYPDVSLNGIDIKNALVSAGILDQNASVKEAMDYMLKASGGMGNIKLSSGASEGLLFGYGAEGDKIMAALLAAKTNGKGVYNPNAVYTRDVKEQGVLNHLMADMIKTYDKKQTKNNDLLDKEYNKTIKQDLGWNMNWWGNKEETAKVQQAWQNKFSDNSWAATTKIIDPETGELVLASTYFDNMTWWDKDAQKDIKVSTKNVGLMSVSRADGQAVLAVPIVDKDGNAHTLMVPAGQFKNESMDKWINSAEYMASRIWNDGIQTNLPSKSYKPNLLQMPAKGDLPAQIVEFNYKKNTVIIDGKSYTRAKGLALVATALQARNLAVLHSGGDAVDETAFEWMAETK